MYKFIKKAILLIALLKLEIITCHGAGILPYSISNDGKIYLYIAKEQSRSGAWADFGGSFELEDNKLFNANKKDAAFLEAAAREFAEESMGIFKDINGLPLYIDNIKNWLAKGESKGVFNEDITFKNGFSYRTYFIPVENSRQIFQDFNNKLKFLKNRCKTTQKFKGMKIHCMLEKTHLASINLYNLESAIENKGNMVKLTGTSDTANFPLHSEIALRGAFIKSLRVAYSKNIFKKLRTYATSRGIKLKPEKQVNLSKPTRLPQHTANPINKDLSELRNDLINLNHELINLYNRFEALQGE